MIVLLLDFVFSYLFPNFTADSSGGDRLKNFLPTAVHVLK